MSGKRRILEVFGEPISRGGQESYVMNSLQHMDLSDLLVDLFTPYYCDNPGCKAFISRHGGEIYTGSLPFSPGSSRKNAEAVLKEHFRNHSYDVVHIHSGSISILAYCARAASKAGIQKIMVHSHSSGNQETIRHRLVKACAAPLMRKYPTDWCACSAEAAQWKYSRDILNKVRILKNGIDPEPFRFNQSVRKEYRDQYGIPDDTLVLGHVGRFTREKNQSFLMDLMAYLLETNPDIFAKLVLVGDGELKERVEEEARQKKLQDHVIFAGASDQVSSYLQMFDIFLFPSFYEGLGIAGLEAQAAGLPVLASDGIPASMKVTDRVWFLSLDEKKAWCEAILKEKGKERTDACDAIKKNGFDIRDTSGELYAMYMN